jgi:hypothetical protein
MASWSSGGSDEIPGDLNQDGKLDSTDLQLLRNLLEQNEAMPGLFDQLPPALMARLDVNGDGQIDYNDVIELCQTILKQESSLPQDVTDKFASLRNKVRSQTE